MCIAVYNIMFCFLFHAECFLLQGLLYSTSGVVIGKCRSAKIPTSSPETMALGAAQVSTECSEVRERPDDPRHFDPQSDHPPPRIQRPRTGIFLHPATKEWLRVGNSGTKAADGFKCKSFVLNYSQTGNSV